MHFGIDIGVVGHEDSAARAHFQHALQQVAKQCHPLTFLARHLQYVEWQDLCWATKSSGLSMAWHCFTIMSISPVSLVARDGVECIVRVVQEASALPHPFPQYKGSNPGTVVTELERQALIPSSVLLAQGAVSKYAICLFSSPSGEIKEAAKQLQTNEPSASAKTTNIALTSTVVCHKATQDTVLDRRLASIRLSKDTKGSKFRTPPPATPPLTPPLTPK